MGVLMSSLTLSPLSGRMVKQDIGMLYFGETRGVHVFLRTYADWNWLDGITYAPFNLAWDCFLVKERDGSLRLRTEADVLAELVERRKKLYPTQGTGYRNGSIPSTGGKK
jgi:hypothetical protein